MKKLVLIDSNALVHRAFHALPMLTSPKGVPTNAVYGFTTILLKMIGILKPEYIAATFDLAGPTFRHEAYEQYKAHREKAPDELYAQIPLVKEMLGAMGIPVYTAKGYEADDVIGSIAETAKKEEYLQVIIVTGDLDTLQLIEKDRVVVFTLRRGMSDTVMYNERSVKQRFGLAPDQMNDFKGLKGDSSDNIPGVPGVGEKTASKLIGDFKSIEKLYNALEKAQKASEGEKISKTMLPTGISEKLAERLLEHKAQAIQSKELSRIIRDVDVSFDLEATDWSKHLDAGALRDKMQELGFYSLAKKLDKTLGEALPEPPKLALDSVRQEREQNVQVITKKSELPDGTEAVVHAISNEKGLASISVATSDAFVVQWDTTKATDLLAVLERYETITCHDAKRLLKLTGSRDMRADRWFDTKLAAWLIAPDLREYDLERVAYETLGHYLEDNELLWPLTVGRLKEVQEGKLRELGLSGIFRDVEMPLVSVLNRMELNGIRVDPAVLKELSQSATRELASLQKKIFTHAGEEFNINSPAQLGAILFEKLGIRGRIKRTSQGALSTAAGELDKIKDEHPIVELILQWRELSKLAGTYIEPFPSLIEADKRIHTTYNQTGTATGRLSSQDPNLQNIPTRSELGRKFRSAFVAEKGTELLSLDYSQIELRIVAHIARDKTMREAFLAGEDIHALTASVVFEVPIADVSDDMRRQAKVLNFGIIYGMGVMGFARAAGVGRDSARQFMDGYFGRFSGVAKYMEATKALAASQGFVSTLLGRHRPLPDINSRMPQLVAQAERMAINHPIQGTSADILKIAMLKLDAHLSKHYGDDARILLQIHDELVLEVKNELLDAVSAQAKEIMESAYPLDVPVVVDVKSGINWSDMKTRQ